MAIKLIAELRSMQQDFPPVLQRIGQYVNKNPDRVVYQTITELGDETKCSLASIQRFYRQLGFRNYGDFKLRLATELASATKRSDGELRTRLDAIVNEGIDALVQTKELVAQDRVKPVAQRLLKSKRIVVFAVAASGVVAQFFRYKFIRLGKYVESLSDPHMAAIMIACMSPKEAFVVFSSSGSSIDAVRLAEMASQREIWTLGVVNRAKSPLTKHLDEQLVVAAAESPLTGGNFSAKVCQMLVVEALQQEALAASEAARRTDQLIAEAVAHSTY